MEAIQEKKIIDKRKDAFFIIEKKNIRKYSFFSSKDEFNYSKE